jgi:NADH pyrophosphatase NudC (nudix superfamily)
MGDFLVLVIMAAALGGIGLYVSAPLLKERRAEKQLADYYEETEMHHLLSRKDSIYTAIKDLEFDYKTGKLSDEDYAELREKFEQQAAAVLKEIDDLQSGKRAASSKKGKTAVKTEAKARFCSACGQKIEPGAKFCPACGERV